MRDGTKSAQLQIRLSPAQKAAILRAARRAGLDMSSYVLGRLLPSVQARFQELVAACAAGKEGRAPLAGLNSFLSGLGAAELAEAVAAPLPAGLSAIQANYIAAMVEYACGKAGMAPPAWSGAIAPLREPEFGSALQSLRLHLLTHSPPPFRRRNIFIDSSIGAQV
jgi:hypothetical protein